MTKTIVIISILTVSFLIACKKTATIPDRFDPVPETNTNVKFLNMSPGTASVNFFTNSTKISAANPSGSTATVVTGLAYPALFPSTIAYATIPSGSLKIDAKISDSASVMPGATVLSTTQTFAAGKFYTFALVDTVTQAKALLVEDDPSVPDQTKAYLRVANFVADSTISIQVLKTSSGYSYSKIYSNVSAKTVLAFDSLGAGTGQVYSVSFMRASNNAVLGTIINFAPSQTKKYTFYMRGLLRNLSTTGFGNYTNF